MRIRRFSDKDQPELHPDTAATKARELTLQVRPLLAGFPSEIQGAVLADLLSLWLAGHLVPGNREETDSLRAFLLNQHIDAVRSLIPSSEAEILEGLPAEGEA
jgi:hypothetical protein